MPGVASIKRTGIFHSPFVLRTDFWPGAFCPGRRRDVLVHFPAGRVSARAHAVPRFHGNCWKAPLLIMERESEIKYRLGPELGLASAHGLARNCTNRYKKKEPMKASFVRGAETRLRMIRTAA